MTLPSSVIFGTSYCELDTSDINRQKPLVNVWLETIRAQLDIERKVDLNHYYYEKPLRGPDVSSVLNDCLYYSECESFDRKLSEICEDQARQQRYRDSLLIRDLERKLSHSSISKYLSQQVTTVREDIEVQNSLTIKEGETIADDSKSFVFGKDKRKGLLLDDEHYEQLFSPPYASNSVITEDSTNMEEQTIGENSLNCEGNTSEQCIGQVFIRMNEQSNSSNRLSLNLLFDENFLDLCKHISSVSIKTNKEITCMEESQLKCATSIEMTIPTELAGDIDIGISLDQTESSCESRNSNYESAVDLEDKLLSTESPDTNVKMRNRTWLKQPRAKSMVEDRDDVTNDILKARNRTSLYEYSESKTFVFPSSSFVRKREEQFLLDCEESLSKMEVPSTQQTIVLPGLDENEQKLSIRHEDIEDSSSCTSLGSVPSRDMASYESFTLNDNDYDTLDSRMMDMTSHTFETLLYIPRQSYPVEDSLSDVTCSHFSSMENIARNILSGNIKRNTDKVMKQEDSDDTDSLSSDVAQWMKDIFNEALDYSDEDWRPEVV